MDFKEQVKNDLIAVFNNTKEFADSVNIYYDNEEYVNIPVVMDRSAAEISENVMSMEERTKEPVLYSVDVTAYVNVSDLGFIPRKNHPIQINDEEFNIISVKEEVGGLALELEALDE